MYCLKDAVNKLTPEHRIYAFDHRRRDDSLGKCFLCLTDVEFVSVVRNNTYGNHFYEILLPDRPTKIFVDIETEAGDYERVKQGVNILENMLVEICEVIADTKASFIILDSSNEKKCSFHLIGGPYFKNLYHVGALLRKLTCFIHLKREEDPNMNYLFDNDGKYIVDEAIYTLNRQFRLAEMCKLGSNRVLKGCTWKESLLQGVCEQPAVCLEIDDAEPLSTSYSALDMFTCVDGVWIRKGACRQQQQRLRCDYLPSALSGVVEFLETQWSITNTQFNISTGCYMMSTPSKHCNIARRTHKGNHIWFKLDPWKREVVQKCFDDSCRNLEYKLNIPPTVWDSWIKMTHRKVDITPIARSD